MRNVNKVFIEVKRISEELENHQEQLLDYSFKQGVKLAILTNGKTWWFYLPLHEGSWEQRRFYTIDVFEQEAEDITTKFLDFLSKDNVASEEAIRTAEAIYKGQQRLNILKETLPKAWNKIIEEGDDLLMDLINETTEKLCGYRADTPLIEQFLSAQKDRLILSAIPQVKRASPVIKPHEPASASILGNYSGKSISRFYFAGLQYEVKSWKDLLIKLCELLSAKHGSEFDKSLNLVGRKRPYFARNRDQLRSPQRIGNTNIFVETNLGANSIVRICSDILALLGYSSNELRLETH